MSNEAKAPNEAKALSKRISRRQLLKVLGAGSLAAVGGTMLSACGRDSATSPAGSGSNNDGSVLASVPSYTNEYFTMWRLAGQEAAEALGVSYTMQSYEGSASTQVNQLQNAKGTGATQVVSFVIDNGAVPKIAEVLNKQDIYLSVAFSVFPWLLPSEDRFGGHFVTSFLPQEVLGQKQLSISVFEAIGGEGNVLYIEGSPTDTTSRMRTMGFEQAVEEFPGIKVLEKQYGNSTGEATRPVIESFLSKYDNDNIDAVICHNSSEALAVNAALRERNLDHIKVGSTDEQAAILDEMIERPNQVAVRSIFGSWLGGYAIARNYDARQGVKFNPVEHLMYQDAVVLDTKESARLYKKIGFESSKTGFDWQKMSRTLNPDNWDTQVAMMPMPPEQIFAKELGEPKPSSFSYPVDFEEAMAAGDIQKYTELYREHVKENPLAPAIQATKAGETVMGISYS